MIQDTRDIADTRGGAVGEEQGLGKREAASELGWLAWSFAGTILLGAFLLFQVQPLISKFILPWFGGVPSVWTTCMLFFQMLLFAGYAYADLSARWLAPRRQAQAQLGLLAAALIVALWLMPPADAWKPAGSNSPTWHILRLLAATVGLPYFVLSTTSPQVQMWFSRAYPGRSPYRLYALSNFGSLVALLSYPLLFEPAFDLPLQSRLWSGTFAIYVVACGACAAWVWWAARAKTPAEAADEGGKDTPRATGPVVAAPRPLSGPREGPAKTEPVAEAPPTWWTRATWVLLPACASLMLLATTNHVCQDVAVVPLLWVVPLALYLLSFIICFDHSRWYVRAVWTSLAALAILGITGSSDVLRILNGWLGVNLSMNYVEALVLHFAAMFFICMVCHGELVLRKPDPRHLTEFYLMIAAGGALGGAAVSLAAPHLFTTFFEWQIGLVASYVLAAGMLVRAAFRSTKAVFISRSIRQPSRDVRSVGTSSKPTLAAALGTIALLGVAALAGLGGTIYWQADDPRNTVEQVRNFYGVISVQKYEPAGKPDESRYLMRHGGITHGEQYIAPAKRQLPLTYYAEATAVGRAIRYLQSQRPTMRLGLVGLGAGTLAAYARPGDEYTFYEINPEVWRLADAKAWQAAHREDRRGATTYFTYLEDARNRGARVEVVLGDARLSLEQELVRQGSRRFDLLVLDAFSGDSVPTHLLTKEAFAIYSRHLAPAGAIGVHITNSYLHLAPVVRGLADHARLDRVALYMKADEDPLAYRNYWMVLSNNRGLLGAIPAKGPPPELADDFAVPLWTDHYSNLFQILRWR